MIRLPAFFILPFLFFLLPPLGGKAQEKTDFFQHYGIGEGLSAGYVTTLFRDSRGDVWVGTQDGLNRFDGYGFETFRHAPFDTATLISNFVSCIAEDRHGYLWVGSFGEGVSRFNPRTGRAEQCCKQFFDGQTDLAVNVVRQVAVVEDDLWISHLAGLSRIPLDEAGAPMHWEAVPLEGQDKPNFIRIERMKVDENGTLWVGTNFGFFKKTAEDSVFKVLGKNFEMVSWARDFVFEEEGRPILLGRDHQLYEYVSEKDSFQLWEGRPDFDYVGRVVTLCRDAAGRLWGGTRDNGFLVRHPHSSEWIHFEPALRRLGGFWSQEVTSIVDGGQGLVWIGGQDGLYAWSPGRNKFKRYTEFNKLAEDWLTQIWAVHLDARDGLWVGTGSMGLARLDRKKGKVEWFGPNASESYHSPLATVSTLQEDLSGNMWAGGMEGLVRIDPQSLEQVHFQPSDSTASALPDIFVRDLALDRAGNLWIATNNGLSYLDLRTESFTNYFYDPNTPGCLPSNHLSCLHIDSRDRLWIGSFRGLACLPLAGDQAPPKDAFSFYRHSPDNPEGLGNGVITAILEDAEGHLWVGASGGLNRFDPASGKSQKFGLAEGMQGPAVYSLLEDDAGNLWIGLSTGISKYDSRSGSFRNFSFRDGLQPGEFSLGASFKAADGELFFGGMEGLNSFYADQLYENRTRPRIHFSSFEVESGPEKGIRYLEGLDKLDLRWDENFFAIAFAVQDHILPEDNGSAYMLEGLESDWVEANGKSMARYAGVPAGEYVFRVRGRNGDGYETEEEARIQIVVRPPFWRQWWFILLCGLALVAAVLWILQTRRRRRALVAAAVMAEQERLRKATARDYHDEMGHYITRIMLLSGLMTRSDSAKEQLDLGAVIQENCEHLARGTRDFIWSLDPNRSSLMDLAEHIGEFGEGLYEYSGIHFRTTGISPSFSQIHLPIDYRRHISMIAKEALHNALKHAQAANVTLHFSFSSPTLSLSISDDGHSTQIPKANGNGLSNMLHRARQFDAELEFSVLNPHGLVVTLSVSLPHPSKS